MPSTAIRRFAYDPESRALDVTFVTGRRYRYFAVPGEVARAFGEASSWGRFFNARVRDHYAFEELAADDAGGRAKALPTPSPRTSRRQRSA